MPLVLVGTKADLDAQRQVLTSSGPRAGREWRCPFLEVTAKSKLMVDQVFTQVVREMEALARPRKWFRRSPPTHWRRGNPKDSSADARRFLLPVFVAFRDF